MDSVSQVANSLGVWLCAFVVVSIVIVQAALYCKLAFKNAAGVGLTKEDCIKGFRTGVISSIGPSISVFVVVFSLAAIIGGPLTWMRLSVIGGSGTELSAASVGATAAGTTLGGADYDLDALATSWWTMTINGCGWLAVVALFTHKMEKVRQKIGGGDPVWMKIFTTTATLGLFGHMSAPYVIQGGGALATVLGGALSMVALTFLSKKANWLKEYALGFALIIGMVLGVVVG